MKSSLRSTLIALGLLLIMAAPSTRAGLVAHLRFDGSLNDETGNHHGASQETPGFDLGKDGEALVLGSVESVVELANPQALEFGKDFSVAVWIQTTHGGEEVVLYRGDPDHFTSPALQLNVQAARFFLYGADQGSFGAGFAGIIANDGDWHHLAVTYSVSTTPHLTLYLDGQGKRPGDSGTFMAGDFVTKSNAPNSVVRLGGRDADSPDYRFRGLLDDLQIYDRALTADQVAFLFANPGSPAPLPAVPVILTQPATNQTAVVGATVSFTVVAEARTLISYQWQRNGTDLPGATNPTLTLTNVGLDQSGTYTVKVTSSAGSVTSNPAVLVVGGGAELDVHMYAGLAITGTPGLNYRIEYQDALAQPNTWVTWTNINLPQSPYLLFDLQSTNAPKRFYRAVTAP